MLLKRMMPTFMLVTDCSTFLVTDFMMSMRSFRHIAIGAALHAFYGYGAGTFIAAFFARTHGIPSGELGTWLAAISCTGGVLGTYLGGYLGDRFAARDRRWYVWVPALSTLFYIPFAFLLYLWPDGKVALMLWFPGALFGGMYLGPTFALTQSLVRPEMRAVKICCENLACVLATCGNFSTSNDAEKRPSWA